MFSSQCACCPVGVEPPEGYNIEITPTLPTEDLVWSDEKHLELSIPTTIKSLYRDLNNDPDLVRQLATNYGCCSSFRVLSNEGSRVLDHVLSGLEKHARSCPRIPKLIRGGTFRSDFLNSMGHSPSILKHVSNLAGCEMIYHPMKIHQLHVNMKPHDVKKGVEETDSVIKKNVDRWHCDSTPFVLIVFCTNPDEYTGGTLQYFNSTKEEGLRILSGGLGLPADRVLNVGRQEKGYGVFMQGWRVFHQVTPVLTGDARTTMVYSFHPRNVLALEACSHLSQTYAPVDPLYIIMPDWVRFRAWKVARRLEILRETFTDEYATATDCACADMFASIATTHARLMHIVRTLPYIANRLLIVARLQDASVALKTYLWYMYPDRMTHLAATIAFARSADDTLMLKRSIGSVADLEEEEFAGTLNLCAPYDKITVSVTDTNMTRKQLAFEPDFMDSPQGLANLLGAVDDLDNCANDVLALKEHESQLLYF